jgi:hypothetical protein
MVLFKAFFCAKISWRRQPRPIKEEAAVAWRHSSRGIALRKAFLCAKIAVHFVRNA